MSYAEENKKTLERFTEVIGEENVIDSKVPKEKRVYVTIKTEKLRDAVTYVKEKEGLFHLSTITGMDLGEER